MLKKYEKEQPLFYNYITKSIKKGFVSHAYLIETNGISNDFTIALDLAKYLLCENKSCDNCNICYQVDNNSYPDLKIIETETKMIKKEQMLELQKEFSIKPLYGKYLIYIIKDAHLLNNSSANTILKFLEEPSENIIAILLTDNSYNVIDTIVSRCQVLTLVNKKDKFDNDLFSKYCPEDVDLDEFIEEEIKQSINFYELLEQYGTSIIAKQNPYIFKEKTKLLLTIGLYFYNDILNNKLNRKKIYYINYIDNIKKIAENNEIDDIIKKIDIINQFISKSDYNVNKELFIDNFMITFTGGVSSD